MRKLKITLLVCGAVALFAGGIAGPSAADGGPPRKPKEQVSRKQYEALIAQCRYAGRGWSRRHCESEVEESYRIGRADPGLDCRSYVGVTVCGTLRLTRDERACVADSVDKGLGRRRAEVECYVYY
ncbi:hypothetical protein AB0K60_31830 [Thermopolyspora sp. NPDC052614]|uniref:hypothetical protein n=1 Tax=Thermopolyspora sp. NPDC052614 TaxID=3155682 RepID=UPI00342E3295